MTSGGNAWGITFSAPAVGAKRVMPGAKMDGQSVFELLDSEKVTFSAAVPTVWANLLGYLRETGKRIDSLKAVISQALFFDRRSQRRNGRETVGA
jgi:fatty-acyl-CoA synthase